MRKLLALTHIQLKDFTNKYIQHVNAQNKWLGLLALAIPVLFVLPAYQLVQSMYEGFSLIGFPELTITYMYLGTVVMMALACIPILLSVFFYSNDSTLLAALPVKVDLIVFSKLASIYIYLFILGALLFGTSIVVYMSMTSFDLYGLALGVVALGLAPILPMTLIALLVIPFMALVGTGKNKNLLVVTGMLLFLVAFISIQLLASRAEMDLDVFHNLLLEEDGLLRQLGRNFPPSIWLTRMIQGSLLDGGLFILLNGLILYMLKGVSSLLYTKGLRAFNEGGEEKQAVNKKGIHYKKRRMGYQMVKRHLAIIIKNPIFLLNTVLTMFLPIIIFIIVLLTGTMTQDELMSTALEPYKLYIYAAIITTPTIVGNLSATAITREGKAFWETRALPLHTTDNLKYRIYTTLIISFASSLLLAVIAGIYLNVSLAIVIRAILFCVGATLFFSTVDIIINIERPLLDWVSPTAAVKNNINVIISLVIRAVIGGIAYFFYERLPNLSANEWVMILTSIFFVLSGVAYYMVFGVYSRRFDQINV
ncbi:ABC-2 type transport system permease protein [Pelagirhabdus alkalitolerans]|uniref:ABC-2 type transport system permease protein n=1 Tax=Pelagirhabdus alkalitolerans TaxID=1612202 RepID=A0A1G6INZ2_9BACI|nr:hypothetical protein [Pelagirhabdus alkalitolerans]SDC08207.1 ABC-2 type transport system permease protein [Pelagirhabdus alkalitolerans]